MDRGRDAGAPGRSSTYSLTAAGRTTLLVAAVALIAGGLTAITEAYAVAAAAAVALMTSGVRALVAHRGVSISRVVTPERGVVGTSFDVELEVRNDGRRSLAPVVLHQSVDHDEVVSQAISSLGPSATVTIRASVPATRRGRVELAPPTYSLIDPFRLVDRRTTAGTASEMIVWPLEWPIAVPLDVAGSGRGPVHSSTGVRASDSDEFSALSEYAPGDDRRHIHWPSSARTGRLMVRRFETHRPRNVHVVLERYADNPAAFEVAVSMCASVISALSSPEDSVSFSTADIDHDMVPVHEPALAVDTDDGMVSAMDLLAVVRPQTRAPRDDGSGRMVVERRLSAIRGALEDPDRDPGTPALPIDRVIVVGPTWPPGHGASETAVELARSVPGGPAVRLIGIPADASPASTDEHVAQDLVDGNDTTWSVLGGRSPVPPTVLGAER